MTGELTNKKQMRVALVGIAPADQVTLKGYMRVLLRLDVNLEWVAVADGNIDLFMIKNDFRSADSVTRLLENNRSVPVLYVANDSLGNGSLNQDTLTIPLKQIGLLSDWLTRNVPALAGVVPSIGGVSPANTQTSTAPTTAQSANQNAAQTQGTTVGQIRTIQPSVSPMQAIIDLIEKLQGRSKSLFEIVEGGVSLAVIDGYRQMVWVQSAHATLSERWQLRPYHGAMPATTPQDVNAWLWQMAWHNPSVVASLIDNHSRYQLRYWVKPSVGQDRRDLLQIMTAMESQPLSVAEIAARAGVSSMTAKNAVASLLLSGNLTTDSYKELKVQGTIEPPKAISGHNQVGVGQLTSSVSTPVSEPKAAPKPAVAPEQAEKLGFLARLRKKLGL